MGNLRTLDDPDQGRDPVEPPPLARTRLVDGPDAPVPLIAIAPRRSRSLEGTELAARYEVETVIGEGGMATVYRGLHKTIHKRVAIKVLDGALDSIPDAVERFLQEAQVTSRITHENVVEVTDFGVTADGVVFCVMELLHGETLGDLVDASGPLPLARAASIMRQVCGALQAAHQHGIIHRDLKPDNCFRCPRTSNPDFIKVLDFGIARVSDDPCEHGDHRVARPRRTEVGCIMGTPDYMAPEQARAEDFDHRVDVYAAGGLFFELLTGRRPYQGKSAAEQLAAHLHLPVPDPGELVHGLCPEVREIVMTAMAKHPDDRYPTMNALAEAITHAELAQRRWGSATDRVLRRAAVVLAAAMLALGYVSLREPPREQAIGAMGELAAPALVVSPRGRVELAPVAPAPITAPPPSPAGSTAAGMLIGTHDEAVLADALAVEPRARPSARRDRARNRGISDAPAADTIEVTPVVEEAEPQPEPERATAAEPSTPDVEAPALAEPAAAEPPASVDTPAPRKLGEPIDPFLPT